MLKRGSLLAALTLCSACGGERTVDITLVRPDQSDALYRNIKYQTTVFTPYYYQNKKTGTAFYACDTIGPYHQANSQDLVDPNDLGVVQVSGDENNSTGFRKYFTDAEQYDDGVQSLNLSADGRGPIMLYFQVWTTSSTAQPPPEDSFFPVLRGCACVRRDDTDDPSVLTNPTDREAMIKDCPQVLKDGQTTAVNIQLGSIMSDDTQISWLTSEEVDLSTAATIDAELTFSGKHGAGDEEIWLYVQTFNQGAARWMKATKASDSRKAKISIPVVNNSCSQATELSITIPGRATVTRRFTCP